MMMLTDLNSGGHAPPQTASSNSSNMMVALPTGLSVTPTAASAHASASANRRPRAQSMQQFGEKASALGSPSASRDCSASGSFVSKLYRMVDSEPSSIVAWTRGGTAFSIVDPKMMAEQCLPKYFRHKRFSSLIRQLNFYSFYRVQEGQTAIYQHSFFRKGRPDLLVHIKRRGAGKAKDPWFDPLATPGGTPALPPSVSSTSSNNHNNNHSASSVSSANSNPNNNTIKIGPSMAMSSSAASSSVSMNTSHSHNQRSPSLNLGAIGMGGALTPSHGMVCYSPMSKPVMMENMSPALKPGMAPCAPPPMLMDMGGPLLGASSDEMLLASKHQQQQRWEQHRASEQQSFVPPGLALKSRFSFLESAASPMLRPSECAGVPAPLDLDIQDFLTEDCSISAGGVGDVAMPFDDRVVASASVAPLPPKHAMVSRDLLKWEETKGEGEASGRQSSSAAGNHEAGTSSSSASSGSFEDELLLDLANVEPDTWEVPLSPLNEEEDMMPWLDLCF